ncbi:hypothetical protein BJ875DRAFT_481032 [Amylocarpus encephaloides]|uniref:Cell cycle control protein n=1 Tax=Amylocarpus encephaloides TaxID=45428 RepID=A0A9P7YQD1_9HELO|nr:hypothetical protein BJ875DRAFT_481032 [Amylocarpus encephaloides]
MSQVGTASPEPRMSICQPRISNTFPSMNDPPLERRVRRRTSHPHNRTPHMQTHRRNGPTEDMSNQMHSQSRPNLQHQASQTIIDLTDESELNNAASRHPEAGGRSQRPPQLGRSDGSQLMEVVDLTEESGEPEMLITGTRAVSGPPPVWPDRPRLRPDPAAHFVPPRQQLPPPAEGPLQAMRRRIVANSVVASAAATVAAYGIRGRRPNPQTDHILDATAFINRLGRMRAQGQAANVHLPGHLDYEGAPFGPRKPEHVPPKPVGKGFTRSANQEDVIVCPSCDEELVHHKDIEEPVAKKYGRAPTRKEREEHPFWVLKDCGHVYCNRCYQGRSTTSKAVGRPENINFPEVTKVYRHRSLKTIVCAVEGCDTEVRNKDKWVGVFL